VEEKLGAEQADALRAMDPRDYKSDLAFMQDMREVLGEQTANDNKTFLIGQAADIKTGLVLIAILSFIASFNASIGPVMWVVFSEIFPTQLRGIAIPTAHLVTAVVNYFVQFLFPWQLSNMGARDIFLFYGVCVAVGLVALSFLLPETKNKTIEQIEAELNKGRTKRT
jgi:MFS family permease